MSAFLEERLPIDIRLGASWNDDYVVDIVTTASGREYRRLVQPYPIRRFNIGYVNQKPELFNQVLALYHRAYGKFAGFRVRAIDDYSTNGTDDIPTAVDQLLSFVSTGVYQLQKEYGIGADGLIDIGRPIRTIYKPVSGSVKIGIRNSITGDHALDSAAYSVDTTTGKVTLVSKTKSITAITKASSAIITVGSSHGFVIGDSVHISGVSGMTQINGLRATITAFDTTKITVAINSSGFSTYTSGGTVNILPQTGETVRGGCEFDIPCRFDSSIEVTPLTPGWAQTGVINIVELIAL